MPRIGDDHEFGSRHLRDVCFFERERRVIVVRRDRQGRAGDLADLRQDAPTDEGPQGREIALLVVARVALDEGSAHAGQFRLGKELLGDRFADFPEADRRTIAKRLVTISLCGKVRIVASGPLLTMTSDFTRAG